MDLALLTALVLLIALLYSSVGHGGASGYLAAMALLGMSPAAMKPTALVLNLLVAGAGSLRYIRSGCFSWRSFWPFALGSIPFAFIGGAHQLTDQSYKRVLGTVLVLAAVGMFVKWKRDGEPVEPPFVPVGVGIGGGIGYLSGLVGVGGGIFLSPVLILFKWATTKQTLGIAALFIFINSAAGLAGDYHKMQRIPIEAAYFAPAALAGGMLGSWLGAKKLDSPILRLLLAAVLLTASLKLLL